MDDDGGVDHRTQMGLRGKLSLDRQLYAQGGGLLPAGEIGPLPELLALVFHERHAGLPSADKLFPLDAVGTEKIPLCHQQRAAEAVMDADLGLHGLFIHGHELDRGGQGLQPGVHIAGPLLLLGEFQTEPVFLADIHRDQLIEAAAFHRDLVSLKAVGRAVRQTDDGVLAPLYGALQPALGQRSPERVRVRDRRPGKVPADPVHGGVCQLDEAARPGIAQARGEIVKALLDGHGRDVLPPPKTDIALLPHGQPGQRRQNGQYPQEGVRCRTYDHSAQRR